MLKFVDTFVRSNY